MRGQRLFSLGVVSIFTSCVIAAVHADGAAPVVANVHAAQRPGTKLVDIYYDLVDVDSPALAVSVAVSINGGATYDLPATHFRSGANPGCGTGVVPASQGNRIKLLTNQVQN